MDELTQLREEHEGYAAVAQYQFDRLVAQREALMRENDRLHAKVAALRAKLAVAESRSPRSSGCVAPPLGS